MVKWNKYEADLSVNVSIWKWLAYNITRSFSWNIGIARRKPNQDTGANIFSLSALAAIMPLLPPWKKLRFWSHQCLRRAAVAHATNTSDQVHSNVDQTMYTFRSWHLANADRSWSTFSMLGRWLEQRKLHRHLNWIPVLMIMNCTDQAKGLGIVSKASW